MKNSDVENVTFPMIFHFTNDCDMNWGGRPGDELEGMNYMCTCNTYFPHKSHKPTFYLQYT